jgi:YebC/PmpR family DNA-binding regulatory protein
MAGHSKWANIKHTKAKTDAKRGKIFTKLIREISTAARAGGGDVNANPRLRTAVDKAFAQNMTKDTVQRAIARGAGGGENDNMQNVRYEGYGPNGVAVMVDCLTDNRNRTVAEVRHAFSKCGGNLGTDGSVSYLFTEAGFLTFAPGTDEERVMEVALEAGADDVTTNEDGSIDVTTSPEQFAAVRDAMVAAKLIPEQADVTQIASTEATLTDLEVATQMMKLTDMLEDLDDVQEVYSNADIPDEILAQL